VQVGGHAIALEPAYAERARHASGALVLGIRPEFVRYRQRAEKDFMPVEVATVEDLGNHKIATARLGAHLVKVKVSEGTSVETGPGWLSFPREWTRLYADGAVLG